MGEFNKRARAKRQEVKISCSRCRGLIYCVLDPKTSNQFEFQGLDQIL